MNQLMREMSLVTILVVGLLSGCSRSAPVGNPTLIADVAFVKPDSCTVTVAGKSFALPSQEEPLRDELRRQSRAHRSLAVRSAGEAPYKCMGHAIYVLQGSGFEQFGFMGREAR